MFRYSIWTEPIKQSINEEAKSQDQIPLKTRANNGKYRWESKNNLIKIYIQEEITYNPYSA